MSAILDAKTGTLRNTEATPNDAKPDVAAGIKAKLDLQAVRSQVEQAIWAGGTKLAKNGSGSTFTLPSLGKAYELVEKSLGFSPHSLSANVKDIVADVVKSFSKAQLNPAYSLTKIRFSERYDEKRSLGLSIQTISGEKVLSLSQSLRLALDAKDKVRKQMDKLANVPENRDTLLALDVRLRHLANDIAHIEASIASIAAAAKAEADAKAAAEADAKAKAEAAAKAAK